MKSNKKNFKYYLAIIEEDKDPNNVNINLNNKEIKLKDFIKSGFNFLIEYFDGETLYTNDLKDKFLMKSSKLKNIIHDFVFDFEPTDYLDILIDDDSDDFSDDEVTEIIADVLNDRINKLLHDLHVIRYNKSNKTLKIINNDKIIDLLDEIFHKNANSVQLNEKSDDVYNEFNNLIGKCMGNNENAIITFNSLDTLPKTFNYDVKKNDNTFYYGIDDNNNDYFPYLLTNFSKGLGSFIVRVFTKQYVNDLPVKELFGFINKNGTFDNIDSDSLNEMCNTDNQTGKKLQPEINVVYCDLNGNRICSEDI
jgi:hypothetical protein